MRKILILVLGSGLALVTGLGPVLAAGLPGEAIAVNSRSCFSYHPEPGSTVKRLLVELHKEQVNPDDPPVLWGGVYAEMANRQHPGFNVDGCGEGAKPGELRCSYSCDAGAMTLETAEGGLKVTPDGLVLMSCGLSGSEMTGFQLNASDVGGGALVTLVDDGECRGVMAPLEKMIEDYENGIE